MVAVVWALKTYRHYLTGVRFTIVTDHSPLMWLMSCRTLTGQHARWALSIQDYDFEIRHRPGVKHQNADALSRCQLPTTEDGTGARLDEDAPMATAVWVASCGVASALLHPCGVVESQEYISGSSSVFRDSRSTTAEVRALQATTWVCSISDTTPTLEDLLGDCHDGPSAAQDNPGDDGHAPTLLMQAEIRRNANSWVSLYFRVYRVQAAEQIAQLIGHQQLRDSLAWLRTRARHVLEVPSLDPDTPPQFLVTWKHQEISVKNRSRQEREWTAGSIELFIALAEECYDNRRIMHDLGQQRPVHRRGREPDWRGGRLPSRG